MAIPKLASHQPILLIARKEATEETILTISSINNIASFTILKKDDAHKEPNYHSNAFSIIPYPESYSQMYTSPRGKRGNFTLYQKIDKIKCVISSSKSTAPQYIKTNAPFLLLHLSSLMFLTYTEDGK